MNNLNRKMPLAWANTSLAHNPAQMITNYRFQSDRDGVVCEFSDHEFRAALATELATMLVEDGVEDGTVQFDTGDGVIERVDSLHSIAAFARTRSCPLRIPPDRLASLFMKSGRGLRPEVQEWWGDTLGPQSQPWRVRRYRFPPGCCRARKVIETFFEFASDADMVAFRLRWI